MLAWTVLALSLVPYDPVVTDTVDIVELNHYLNAHSGEFYDQYIYWEWYYDRFLVVDWRHARHITAPTRCGKWYVFYRVDHECIRRIRSTSIRETWTDHDPERAELKMNYGRRLLSSPNTIRR